MATHQLSLYQPTRHQKVGSLIVALHGAMVIYVHTHRVSTAVLSFDVQQANTGVGNKLDVCGHLWVFQEVTGYLGQLCPKELVCVTWNDKTAESK